MKPIAFVIPWYGKDIQGGAEKECYHLAHSFAKRGLKVEVLTTCVKDAASDRGENTMSPGVYEECGVGVRRFLVKSRDSKRFHISNERLYNNQHTTLEDEKAYLEEDINSPAMYQYIRENRDEYECFIFMPYLYGPTYFGSKECPDNCMMIPCLHDESYAYMQLMKDRMCQFKGMIFLSNPEAELANQLYDLSKVKKAVLGAYVDSGWENDCKPDEFSKKYGICDDFILYAGRKDAGKKADELMRFFIGYKKLHPTNKLKLVMLGSGTVKIPDEFKGEILDLGFVSDEDKHNALSAALFLCNPSYYESFSIIIMESWLVKKPVLVSSHCTVTTDFCIRSNGGLYYKDFPMFCGCVDYLLEHIDERNLMGINGRNYVRDNFVEDRITDQYLKFLFE